MNFSGKAVAAIAAFLGLGAMASAQVVLEPPFFDEICIPADNEDPYSDDFNTYPIANDLFGCTVGVDGTVDYGACWTDPALTNEVTGRIGFTIGRLGSIQDEYDPNDPNYRMDNNLRLTFGMPISPGANWGYAMVVEPNLTRARFGANEITFAFIGASDRYLFVQSEVGGTDVRLQVDVLGDAARLAWKLRSTSDAPLSRALWFGQYVAMLDRNYREREANFVTVPGQRPLRTAVRFSRVAEPATFPEFANFANTQTNAFGLQVLNGLSDTTADANGLNSEQSEVQEFSVGHADFLLGPRWENGGNLPDSVFGDTWYVPQPPVEFGRGNTAYIQKFGYRDIPPNTESWDSFEPQFVAFYKSITGRSNYARPYSLVVDAPHLVQTTTGDPRSFTPNPSRIRVYVDNTRGFSTVDREIPLSDVQVTLNLPNGMFIAQQNPDGSFNLNPQVPQQTASKFIDRIDPRQIRFVDFMVGTHPNAVGTLTYQVQVRPNPGPLKTINGDVIVASQPRLLIRGAEGGITSANLVALPWEFGSTSWETILSFNEPMRLDLDFRAFTFDAELQQYVVQSTPRRNQGTWIISQRELGFTELGGAPQQPADLRTGAPLLRLAPGWNLIGNPYNYAFPLAQTVGVSSLAPGRAFPFQALVDQGAVSGSLAFWDQDAQQYRFVDTSGFVQPNRGYWIFVAATADADTGQSVSLNFPPIFQPFLRGVDKPRWTQSDRMWRLQLAARTDKMTDDQNFIGVVPDAETARRMQSMEPPVAPVDHALSLSVRNPIEDGRALSGLYSDRAGRQEYEFEVFTRNPGNVTVTWPNLGTLPKNLRFRLLDVATGTTRDMRRNSGYTFTSDRESSTRSFKVVVEPGTVARATIGSVLVSREGRDRNGPITVNYTLTSDATVTVRILRPDGQEVFVPARGRADSAGPNTVTWNLRDRSNRAVPPGAYRVEIVASTTDGERVRRIVPVTVIR